jgi:rhamnose transport system ATP-binding protein
MYKLAEELLTNLGVKINPHTKMRGLSIADQQMVDMASALSQNARVILMDEPTASLTPSEVSNLFVIMRRLREQGVAIVFVSHRLEEIFEICDRITVLRDGEYVGERNPETTSMDEIISLMVGRSVSVLFEKPVDHHIGQPILEVEGLSRRRKFRNISFDVRAGEIVGVAGLVGAGRTDVGRALVGIQDIDAGSVKINGRMVTVKSPQDALAYGMVYLPEDRQQHGLLMPMSVAQNATIPVLKALTKAGWLNDQVERDETATYVEKLNINLRHVDQPVKELSGGNQQKVVLSKWLMTEPRLMILDEPTRGIDVGAKVEIHRLMSELTQQGLGILMISSELPEILALSDRIIVMREGEISAYFERGEATPERVMAAATGQSLAIEAESTPA